MTPVTWEQLRARCYVPYSGIEEVCIVEGKTGTLYPGVRIENISFPLVMDAIQVAIYSCMSENDEPVSVMIPESICNEVAESKCGEIPSSQQVISNWCSRYSLRTVHVTHTGDIDPHRFFQTAEKTDSFDRLQALTSRCLISYSDFPVSAMLRTDKGFFSGVNIEVDDWQKGLCAERVALGKARSAGAAVFQEIHVYAPKSDYVSPCGACRQVLVEWMSDGVIILIHNDSERTRLFIPELLPYQFKAGSLLKKHR